MKSSACRIRTSSSLAVVIVCAAGIVMMSSCEPVNPFPEYVGVNLLESRGVSPETSAAGYLAGPLPAMSFDYIVLTPLTAAEYGAAPHGTPVPDVYRLELVNLFPDGDFEATAPGASPADWEDNGPDFFEVADDPGPGLTGRYLAFDVTSPSYARLELDAHLLDGLVADATYHLELETVRKTRTSAVVFDYGDDAHTSHLKMNGLSWTFEQAGKQDTPVEVFPNPGDETFNGPGSFYANAAGDGYFSVGSPLAGTLSAGYVDNIRVSRVDIMPHWSFVVPVDPLDAEALLLVPGRYRFRVFVKDEIDSQVTPNVQNRFRSRQITIGVDGAFSTYSGTALGWDSTQWIEVIHEFRLTAAQLASSAAVRIQLTPSSLDTPRIGSILISSPVLELVF